MTEPQRVQVEFPAGMTMKYDRGVTKFRLWDCYQMGFAVGAGLLCGLLCVSGVLLTIHSILKWIFE